MMEVPAILNQQFLIETSWSNLKKSFTLAESSISCNIRSIHFQIKHVSDPGT